MEFLTHRTATSGKKWKVHRNASPSLTDTTTSELFRLSRVGRRFRRTKDAFDETRPNFHRKTEAPLGTLAEPLEAFQEIKIQSTEPERRNRCRCRCANSIRNRRLRGVSSHKSISVIERVRGHRSPDDRSQIRSETFDGVTYGIMRFARINDQRKNCRRRRFAETIPSWVFYTETLSVMRYAHATKNRRSARILRSIRDGRHGLLQGVRNVKWNFEHDGKIISRKARVKPTENVEFARVVSKFTKNGKKWHSMTQWLK